MFKWLNKTGVENDRGFAVQSIDRFTVEYREAEKKVSVYVENGFCEGYKPCVIIEPSAFQRWDGDPSYVSLPEEKQDEMMENFTEAMEFQGIAVVTG